MQIQPDQNVLAAGTKATPVRTLVDILAATAGAHPGALALEDQDGAISYRELISLVSEQASRLSEIGVRRGDKVGIRISSGTRELYISILAILVVGAAYVPVDADDPDERARLVFGEARVIGVIGLTGRFELVRSIDAAALAERPLPAEDDLALAQAPGVIPTPDDDAWVIFTSGSTGVPKGVAVTHRSAAAFVDAEAGLFLRTEPIGPADRVLAGLSVAFDASCEEMWLAWRNGACLVTAPRALVRSGADLGPWLIAHGVTVVSTVPTLAALWPDEALEQVRLLIFGGEACPPELSARLVTPGREVWNTYGPTEATVVACAALLDGTDPVRIGLPLHGWDLAVVDAAGARVAHGGIGELIIGGVGLARYLDPAKDREKYAAHPGLGWDRAYRSGDLVRFDREGLVFVGRADDQVKLGGRRIELGEIEAALRSLPGVAGAAAVVQRTPAGNQVLVGYLALADGAAAFDRVAATDRLRAELPAALVPLLALVDELPTRTSGKVDKAALPWPLPASAGRETVAMTPTATWLAGHWAAILGVPVGGPDADFFAHGGGSLSVAQFVSAIRERFPDTRISDVYDQPRIGALADELDSRVPPAPTVERQVLPVPARSRIAQTLLGVPLHVLVGARWLVFLSAANNLLATWGGAAFAPTISWWWVTLGFVLFVTPPGKMAISVVAARLLLRGVTPGDYSRGGSVHLRLWLAEQVALLIDAASLAGAPWISYYARALGARVGEDVDLHALPPVTGMLTIGARAAIEPETDLAGYWLDGDVLRLGHVQIGADATVGARSTLLGGARIGAGAVIDPGAAVSGAVPAGERWAGSPAVRVGAARGSWPAERPPRARRWLIAFAAGAVGMTAIPAVAAALGVLVVGAAIGDAATLADAFRRAALAVPLAVVVAGLVYATLVVAAVRLVGVGLREGYYPVRSRIGWQVWMTERILDGARTLLFPIYASLLTPVWLRLLGAKVGAGVEASTVLLIPSLTTIAPAAFLADDTMVACYELGGGWLRIGRAKIGRRAFLGNSGMAGPGRTVPRNGLVAVLSSTPRKAKRGSSWLGNPPERLRRMVTDVDEARTFRPPARLRTARALWEVLRIVPVIVTALIALGVLAALDGLWLALGLGWTVALSGVVMLGGGAVAAGITTVAKWTLVGRITATEHPLWSSFIWRNEVSDCFVEMVARPWFAAKAVGSPVLSVWLRSLGARVGHGVWCETYWLPEADLVSIGEGVSVNRGCVVQTHLFHDRIMQLDRVDLGAGSTLGPHSVILPAAAVDQGATVGPASLVMRGERVPAGSLWSGNPISPWRRPPWQT
ncbi:amino acid adenylation domain-containing protein [Cryobacterium sp. PH31-AA6]|uniref:Pls/PosA family non-ribosomal peptide synthetase n=1 Tax=Cryobacterium sp. PH31-AA6 TaxID=3046205 RepID=UPI0024B99131|nr:Pls/PosA family non-ribosomal peptide synthetase [Cryobacterium sp. PH31-AA6]MDJ0324297.1 amino acid adenylation domain-containing protein [Cryobacterium sp. PH31-AA6]